MSNYQYPFPRYSSFTKDLSSEKTESGDSRTSLSWLNFHIVEYSKDAISKPGELNRKSTITLPLPAELKSPYSSSWGQQSLGATGDSARKTISEIKDKVSGGSSLADAVRSSVTADRIWEAGKNLAVDVGMNVSEVVAGGLTNAVMQGLGVVRNPFNAVLFEGPQFREFHFDWKLIPRNEEESKQIYEICKSLKAAQAVRASAFANVLMEYPYIVEVETSVQDKTFKIAPCAITDLVIDVQAYGPNAYHRSGYPAGVNLSVGLKELVILTQESIEEGF